MSKTKRPLRSVALFTHLALADALSETQQVADYLTGQDLQVCVGNRSDNQFRTRVENGEFDLLIALGGDGTMLRAGHLCGPFGVPVLGINLGRLGFLTEIDRKEWREVLPQLLRGEYWIEERMMLRATHTHLDQAQGSWEVLNEVFVGRGEQVRAVHLTTYLDDSFLTTYVADGLIAATPTGSTAYALAAGGPILPPTLRNILIVPVAPHLSIDRPIILAEGSAVSVTVHTTHQAALSIDGQPTLPVADGDTIRVSASEHTVQFVRFQDPGYFYRNLTSHMNQNPSSGNLR
jgi:NAD+ kinase